MDAFAFDDDVIHSDLFPQDNLEDDPQDDNDDTNDDLNDDCLFLHLTLSSKVKVIFKWLMIASWDCIICLVKQTKTTPDLQL